MFQKFDFPGCQGVKRQKLAKNDQQFSVSCLIFQEPYIIRSFFMVQICKRIISPGSFFIFSKYILLGLLRDKGAKNDPKFNKTFCQSYLISGTVHHDFDFWCMCKMLISLGAFFHFFKILIFVFLEG